MHLAGSLLPWTALAFLLETNYGSVRVVLLWFVTLLGAAFASAILDPHCNVVSVLLQQPHMLCTTVLQQTNSKSA
jgi:membrane associated rhomboid family serine protease